MNKQKQGLINEMAGLERDFQDKVETLLLEEA
jgi:hypothetical protein